MAASVVRVIDRPIGTHDFMARIARIIVEHPWQNGKAQIKLWKPEVPTEELTQESKAVLLLTADRNSVR